MPTSSGEMNGVPSELRAIRGSFPNQFPAATTGYWVISYKLYGLQQIGAPCPGPQAAAPQP